MNKRAFIPISALMGALLLALVAAMTPFVAEPDIAYAQTSADTTLGALTVVGQPTTNPTPPPPPTGVSAYSTLDPTLQSDPTADAWTTEYDVRIPFVQTSVLVTVMPTAHGVTEFPSTSPNDDAIVTVNGQRASLADASGNFTRTVPVAAGTKTTITIAVTAQSRNSTRNYTVRVYRESSQTRDDNANLASLSLSGASLDPGFGAGTIEYDARVQSGSTTLAYTLSDQRGGASASITAPTACTGGATTNCVSGKKVYLQDEATTTAITVVVTPESGTDDNKTYTINVYRIRDNRETDADLALSSDSPAGLTITAVGTGSPGFVSPSAAGDVYDTTTSAVRTSSKLRVNNDTSYVTVEANAADVGATAVISPSDARLGTGDGITGHQVALTAGRETPITVTVTAEDPAVKKTYTVIVYRNRATLSEDNNLNSLSLSTGALDPVFKKDTITYDAQVGPTVNKVTVNYAGSDTAGGSAVVVATTTAGASVANNKDVTLAGAGTTTVITVTVTPEAGTNPKIYTINVYRLRSAPSADASLNALSSSPATIPPLALVAGTKMYNVEVANSISAITVTAAATSASNGATVAITPNRGTNVALAVGAKTAITVTVTAEDRTTTDTYMVYVYRQRATLSDDATLSALSLSAGTLSPTFMSDTIEYKARVANDVDEVTVSPTLTDNAGGASVAVSTPGPDGVCSGADNEAASGNKVRLSPGANTTICVITTAEDESPKTYTITVYRIRANPSDDADLTSFTIAEATGSLDIDGTAPSDPPTTLDLRSESDPDVVYRIRQVTVVAMADVGAIVTIMPADANVGMMGHQVNLTAGAETMITATVQPEDPTVPAESHTAMVYRKNTPGSQSDDATLSSLMLSGVTLMYTDDNDMDMTGFMSDVMAYTGNVASARTTVTAMANHLGAQSGITITPADADLSVDGHQVNIASVGGQATVTVQVRPESVLPSAITAANNCAATSTHSDLECYTVMLTRTEGQEPRDEAALRIAYDTNGTPGIQIDEAVEAVKAYARTGDLALLEEAVTVIKLYVQDAAN